MCLPDKKISELLNNGCISLELCPNRQLNLDLLNNLKPKFCSVTWLEQDLSNLDRISAVLFAEKLLANGFSVLLHLVGRTLKDEQMALNLLRKIREKGIRNLLVVQGDPSTIKSSVGQQYRFPYAADLIKFIRENFQDYFCIAVAAYPENHPDSKNITEEFTYLKNKVSMGADFIITQAAFTYESYENFCLHCKNFDINIPVLAGIFIITSYDSILATIKFCKISLSENVKNLIESMKNKPEELSKYGMSLVTDMVKQIISHQSEVIKGIHIFSMNNLECCKLFIDGIK